MISTVVTSTVTAITTTTTVTTMVGFGLTLGLMAVITLIAFLGVRELVSASQNGKARLLARSFDIGIVPLTIAFTVILAMGIVEILAR